MKEIVLDTIPKDGDQNISLLGANYTVTSSEMTYNKLRPLSGCTEDSLINCGNHTIMSSAQEWMILVETIHFYLLPCVIGLAVLLAFVNCIVLLRQIRSSIDCYILGMVVASLLLLLCSIAINLKLYVGHLDIFGYIYGYMKSCQEWFWYTTIWLLLVMCLERCMNLSSSRNRALCSPFQAGITVVMTYLVCLVSALPRFWEFEPSNHRDILTNQTSIVAAKSASTDTPEYNVMYFWYTKVITVFLPIPCMFITMILLCCGMKKPVASKRQLSQKHSSGHSTGQVMKRKVTEEIRLTQLLIFFIIIYILFTSPYVIVKLLYKMMPEMFLATDPFYASLERGFQVLFYLNYTLHFLGLICFSWGYRKVCCNTCCCCCCGKNDGDYELAPQRNHDYY